MALFISYSILYVILLPNSYTLQAYIARGFPSLSKIPYFVPVLSLFTVLVLLSLYPPPPPPVLNLLRVLLPITYTHMPVLTIFIITLTPPFSEAVPPYLLNPALPVLAHSIGPPSLQFSIY